MTKVNIHCRHCDCYYTQLFKPILLAGLLFGIWTRKTHRYHFCLYSQRLVRKIPASNFYVFHILLIFRLTISIPSHFKHNGS